MIFLGTTYDLLLVQPVYNAVMFIQGTIAQDQTWLTFTLIGIVVALLALPAMITGYFDQERTRDLNERVEAIKQEVRDKAQQEQLILKLLHKKQIRFQSESVFLFGLALILLLLYPVVLYHWSIDPHFLYPVVPQPRELAPNLLGFSLAHSDAILSLVPCILLFFELRQSYREQQFLTSFVDRWYPVILPLCIYLLLFWLPGALSLVLAASIAVSLYLRSLLHLFTRWRARPQP